MSVDKNIPSEEISKRCRGLRELLKEHKLAKQSLGCAQRVGHVESLNKKGDTDEAGRLLGAIFRELQADGILNQDFHIKHFPDDE